MKKLVHEKVGLYKYFDVFISVAGLTGRQYLFYACMYSKAFFVLSSLSILALFPGGNNNLLAQSASKNKRANSYSMPLNCVYNCMAIVFSASLLKFLSTVFVTAQSLGCLRNNKRIM